MANRVFEYVEPSIIRKTEEEIMREYWPFWEKRMRDKGEDESVITKEQCLTDWMFVHWAHEVLNPTKEDS